MHQPFNTLLLQHQQLLQPVVPFHPDVDKAIAVDLSVNNSSLHAEVFGDINRFTAYMDAIRKTADARYAIGGYAEHRQVYSSSSVFDASENGEEPRRLHLGIDVWGEAHTPVMSPLDGKVHSTGFNNARGDYGGTVILEHEASGFSFYTLYGHLTATAVKHNKSGQLIKAGEVFAHFGKPEENGHWPPHLHFQVILDMQGWVGDYPGVCKYTEKESWLANCPNGDILLGLGSCLSHSG